MITKIESLADYRQAEREWCVLYEYSLAVNDNNEVNFRMYFLTHIMEEWARTHSQEIWPTLKGKQ